MSKSFVLPCCRRGCCPTCSMSRVLCLLFIALRHREGASDDCPVQTRHNLRAHGMFSQTSCLAVHYYSAPVCNQSTFYAFDLLRDPCSDGRPEQPSAKRKKDQPETRTTPIAGALSPEDIALLARVLRVSAPYCLVDHFGVQCCILYVSDGRFGMSSWAVASSWLIRDSNSVRTHVDEDRCLASSSLR